MENNLYPNYKRLYIAWFSIAIFFFYQYLARVLPGIIATDLRNEFKLAAQEFSTLGSLYLLAYALVQIPFGLIIDKVGVKRMATLAVILSIISGVIFSFADSLFSMQVSRFLLGASSGCALMCSLKFSVDNFPVGKRGFLMGASLSIGTFGPVVSGSLMVEIINNFGWRNAAFYTSLSGLLIVFAILYFVKRESHLLTFKCLLKAENDTNFVDNLIQTIKNIEIIKYGFLAIGLFTPLSVLADLWGTSFLVEKYAIPHSIAAMSTALVYLGLTIGSLIIPHFAEKHNMMNETIQVSLIIISLILLFIVFGPAINEICLLVIIFILGLLCGAEMICFAGATSSAPADKSGITIGVVNTMNMMGGAILQQAIGFLLDLQWDGTYSDTMVRLYNRIEFENALSSLVITLIISCIVSSTIKRNKIHN